MVSISEVIVSSDNVSRIRAANGSLVEIAAAKENLISGIPIGITLKETIYTLDHFDSIVLGHEWGVIGVGVSTPAYPTVSIAPVPGPIISVASISGSVTSASVAQIEAA